jgi:hypothetical protein
VRMHWPAGFLLGEASWFVEIPLLEHVSSSCILLRIKFVDGGVGTCTVYVVVDLIDGACQLDGWFVVT